MEKKTCCILEMDAKGSVYERWDTLIFLHCAGEGINAPCYGCLQKENAYGYIKSCANTDAEMEQVEFLLAYLGECLGVSMARTALLYDEDRNRIGCFSYDVGANALRYETAAQIRENWLLNMAPIPTWALAAAQIHAAAPKVEPFFDHRYSLIEDEENLRTLVAFIYRLLTMDEQWDGRQGFVDMVLFDCLTRQKDRNLQGFGMIEREDHSMEVAALYDNATILMPGLDAELNGFCNVLCDGMLLAKVVAAMFPTQALDFAKRLAAFLQQGAEDYCKLQDRFLSEDYSRQMQRSMQTWEDLLCVIRTAAESI